MVESPHKIAAPETGDSLANLTRELQAVNDFITYYESVRFLSPEKGHNFERVAS